MKKRKKKFSLKKILFLLIGVILIAGGFSYWHKYTEGKKRKLAEEEKKRQAELEKEKQRQMIEQKKKELMALIEEMKKYLNQGNYKKVKELAEKAFSLAHEYNFPVDEIEKILHQMEVAIYKRKLQELKKANENVFNYFYVRKEVLKIPDWKELVVMKKEIYNQTFKNEYSVLLILAETTAKKGKEGENIFVNYFLSKDYLYKAKDLRKKYNITPNPEKEKEIEQIEKDTFFAWKKFREISTPSELYQ